MLYETWESHEDVLNVQNCTSPTARRGMTRFPILLEGERDISIWEPLRADRNKP